MKKINYNKIVLVLSFVFLLTMPIVKYWSLFKNFINISEYEAKYSTSQYVLGEASPQKISDSELYVYAGYAYWQGEDPTTINFEHPPLAKYVYGLVYQLFGNPYWLNIPLFFGILFVFYKLSSLITKNELLRIVGLLLVGTLSLIQVHLRYVLLDLPLLFGYLLFFYGLLADFKLSKKSILIGIGLGISLTVKYPIPLAMLLFGFLAINTIKTKKWRVGLLSSLIAVGIYFLSYLQFFLHDHNLIDWIAFEKYRLNWFLGKTDAPKFLIFHTLFTGSFRTWWNNEALETTRHWSILWPISFIMAIFGFVLSMLKRNYIIFVLLGFSFMQLMIYALGAAASDRFFITLLPFWVLGSIYFVENLLLQKFKFKNRN